MVYDNTLKMTLLSLRIDFALYSLGVQGKIK